MSDTTTPTLTATITYDGDGNLNTVGDATLVNQLTAGTLTSFFLSALRPLVSTWDADRFEAEYEKAFDVPGTLTVTYRVEGTEGVFKFTSDHDDMRGLLLVVLNILEEGETNNV